MEGDGQITNREITLYDRFKERVMNIPLERADKVYLSTGIATNKEIRGKLKRSGSTVSLDWEGQQTIVLFYECESCFSKYAMLINEDKLLNCIACGSPHVLYSNPLAEHQKKPPPAPDGSIPTGSSQALVSGSYSAFIASDMLEIEDSYFIDGGAPQPTGSHAFDHNTLPDTDDDRVQYYHRSEFDFGDERFKQIGAYAGRAVFLDKETKGYVWSDRTPLTGDEAVEVIKQGESFLHNWRA